MKISIKNRVQSELVRNSTRLISANVFAQAVGLLVYPILTRLYTPNDFGLLNLFMSIGGILTLLSTSEYQSAVLLPSDEREGAGVARVALRLVAIVTCVVLLSVPFSAPIARLFNAQSLSKYYWLLVPYVAVMGCWTVYNAWLTRRRNFKRISGFQVNQSITGVLTKLFFGVVGWLRGGLLFSSVLSPIVAFGTAAARSKEDWKALWVSSDVSPRELAKRYRRFPLYSMPRALVNNLSGNLPALLLTPYFGLHQLGFFAMATTLAFRPITMITASLHQVLFEHVAQAVRGKQSIGGWLRRQWLRMAVVVVPIMAGLAIIMPWLVRVLLGAGWEETATLIRYMMPWLTCVFIVSPLAFISEVFGKQRLFLVLEVLYLALRVLSMAVGIWIHSFEWAIILLSVSGTLMLLVQLVCYVIILRRYESARLLETSEER